MAIKENYWIVFTIAIIAGCWNIYALSAPGVFVTYEYLNQGQVDYLQSEIPEENPPIRPSKSLKQWLIEVSPSALGVIAGFLYIGLAAISALQRKDL